MFKRLKVDQSHLQIVKNFGYLSFFQIFNMIFPLLVYPFLIETLGKDNFGLIIYAQAITMLFVVLVNFGFNITATKEISINRENKAKVSQIVSSVLLVKACLFVISIFLLWIFLPLIKIAKGEEVLFYLSMYVCISELLFPIWYFQGVERMKHITIINFVTKLISVTLIFLLIDGRDDYLMVPFIYTITSLIGGVISIYIIFYKDKVQFIFSPINQIIKYAKDGFFIFLSRASFIGMESISKIIIESYVGLGELAVYDLVLKITAVLKKPFLILSQSIYPNLSKTKNMIFSRKILYFSSLAGVLLYLTIILLTNVISTVFLLEPTNPLINLSVLIMGVSIPLTALTWGLGENMLVVMGYYREYNFSTILQMVVYLFLLYIFYNINNTISYEIILYLYIIPVVAEVLVRYTFAKKYNLL